MRWWGCCRFGGGGGCRLTGGGGRNERCDFYTARVVAEDPAGMWGGWRWWTGGVRLVGEWIKISMMLINVSSGSILNGILLLVTFLESHRRPRGSGISTRHKSQI
ncbi:hypothetical protein Hdeb2414_s0016g00495441 [Helianthus debilis subsp. tardiflorus]